MSNLLQTVIPAAVLAWQRRITQYGGLTAREAAPAFHGNELNGMSIEIQSGAF